MPDCAAVGGAGIRGVLEERAVSFGVEGETLESGCGTGGGSGRSSLSGAGAGFRFLILADSEGVGEWRIETGDEVPSIDALLTTSE